MIIDSPPMQCNAVTGRAFPAFLIHVMRLGGLAQTFLRSRTTISTRLIS
jgi:hypothetical protein